MSDSVIGPTPLFGNLKSRQACVFRSFGHNFVATCLFGTREAQSQKYGRERERINYTTLSSRWHVVPAKKPALFLPSHPSKTCLDLGTSKLLRAVASSHWRAFRFSCAARYATHRQSPLAASGRPSASGRYQLPLHGRQVALRPWPTDPTTRRLSGPISLLLWTRSTRGLAAVAQLPSLMSLPRAHPLRNPATTARVHSTAKA